MRIGAWNVEFARPARLDALRRTLSENCADIWILTETHDELAPRNCPYVAHCDPRPQEWSGIRDGSRWASVWSRYPIMDVVRLPKGDRQRTIVAHIELERGMTLLVYGTVLPWKGDRGIFDWSEHHRVIAEQYAEWRTLRERIPGSALCVAGDYNTDMATGGFYGTRQGIAALRAGFRACGLFCATEPSFVPAGLLPEPAIDHIALPEAWRDRTAIAAAWPADKGRLSDHSGIVVEIA